MLISNWFLLVVVGVAFIAGYLIANSIIEKIRVRNHTNTRNNDRIGKTKQDNYMGFNDGNENRGKTQDYAQERVESWNSQSAEERYKQILGLSGNYTLDDVKRSYRALIAKYHPDKIGHLGDEFNHLAEEKTRDIIEAYNYLRAQFDHR